MKANRQNRLMSDAAGLTGERGPPIFISHLDALLDQMWPLTIKGGHDAEHWKDVYEDMEKHR